MVWGRGPAVGGAATHDSILPIGPLDTVMGVVGDDKRQGVGEKPSPGSSPGGGGDWMPGRQSQKMGAMEHHDGRFRERTFPEFTPLRSQFTFLVLRLSILLWRRLGGQI